MSGTRRYRRARTIPELARAHCSTLGLPDSPASELAPTRGRKIAAVLVGFAAALAVAIPAAALIDAGLSGPPAWAVTLLMVVSVVKAVQYPVHDRVAGRTRLREVAA